MDNHFKTSNNNLKVSFDLLESEMAIELGNLFFLMYILSIIFIITNQHTRKNKKKQQFESFNPVY